MRKVSGSGSKTTKPRSTTLARKEQILAAALDCFDDLGVKVTTVQHIQERARCSVGSLYHHFGSKEGVAEALFLDVIARFNESMLRRLRRCDQAEETVRAVVEGYADWSSRHSKLARYLHSRDIDFSDAGRAARRDLYRNYIRQVNESFAPFVMREEIAVLPLHAYVPLISGPIEAYVRRWLAGDAPPPVEVKEVFANAAWNAVKGPAG